MKQLLQKIQIVPPLCLGLYLFVGCSPEPEARYAADPVEIQQVSVSAQLPVEESPDIIARVGDQAIRFSEINTIMSSSAIVGLSMPALGTPERDTVRLTLLDKLISANLLYLDALKQGVDLDPVYRHDIDNFSSSMLASIYRQRNVNRDIEVTEAGIQNFFKHSIAPGTELTEEVRAGIEATIRKNKYKSGMVAMSETLREGVDVVIGEEMLDLEEDAVREDSAVVARVQGEVITWGKVKLALGTPRNTASMANRLKTLNAIIDNHLMIDKAKQAGLEDDPVYLARLTEYRKTRLVNLHRGRLLKEMEPDAGELKEFYDEHRGRIEIPEVRDIQILVVDSREQAEEIRQKILANETTLSKAVADFSTVPDAKTMLGKLGWVSRGSGFPDLDALTFSLGPGEVGGPVQSPAGWHLVKVLDMRDAENTDIEDPHTRKNTRRLILDERLDRYVVNLRENEFAVEIDEKTLNQLAQGEVDRYVKMSKTKQLSPEQVKEKIEKLRK